MARNDLNKIFVFQKPLKHGLIFLFFYLVKVSFIFICQKLPNDEMNCFWVVHRPWENSEYSSSIKC